jgi:ABC-type transport system substrate-binding protein
MLQNLRKKEFDATILGWALNWKSDPFQIFHGSQADLPESSNSGGYQNPEVDKLIEELRVTLDEDKQTEIFHKIHKLIYDDQPYTFLFMDKATAGYDTRLENIQFYKIRPGVDLRDWTAIRIRALGQ